MAIYVLVCIIISIWLHVPPCLPLFTWSHFEAPYVSSSLFCILALLLQSGILGCYVMAEQAGPQKAAEPAAKKKKKKKEVEMTSPVPPTVV